MGLFGKTEEKINEVSLRVDGVEGKVADIVKTNLRIDKELTTSKEKQEKLLANDVQLTKKIIELSSNYEKLLLQLKEISDAQNAIINESKTEKEVKKEFPDELTIQDVCRYLKYPKLDSTTFRYYLHDIGLMNLKINKYRNTYSLVENFKELDNELLKYVNVHDMKTITFTKESLGYFAAQKDRIIESVEKYHRQLTQFNKSKEIINGKKAKSYIDEIHYICGISTNGNYNGEKYGAIYKEYSKVKPNWYNEFKKYETDWIASHPEYDKNSKHNKEHPLTRLKYIVSVFNDGDILLRIACELFVA